MSDAPKAQNPGGWGPLEIIGLTVCAVAVCGLVMFQAHEWSQAIEDPFTRRALIGASVLIEASLVLTLPMIARARELGQAVRARLLGFPTTPFLLACSFAVLVGPITSAIDSRAPAPRIDAALLDNQGETGALARTLERLRARILTAPNDDARAAIAVDGLTAALAAQQTCARRIERVGADAAALQTALAACGGDLSAHGIDGAAGGETAATLTDTAGRLNVDMIRLTADLGEAQRILEGRKWHRWASWAAVAGVVAFIWALPYFFVGAHFRPRARAGDAPIVTTPAPSVSEHEAAHDLDTPAAAETPPSAPDPRAERAERAETPPPIISKAGVEIPAKIDEVTLKRLRQRRQITLSVDLFETLEDHGCAPELPDGWQWYCDKANDRCYPFPVSQMVGTRAASAPAEPERAANDERARAAR